MNTPRIMKKLKRALPVAMAIVLGSTAAPLVVRADSSKVVTLGANLTDSQKNSMYEYFGTSSDKAEVIEVTNADERKYLEGVAPDEQIGTRTLQLFLCRTDHKRRNPGKGFQPNLCYKLYDLQYASDIRC